MTTKQLSHYLLDEELCEKYLREAGLLKTFSSCPACNSAHFDRVRRQRYMCYECRYEWNIRRGSKLEGSHLALSAFISIIKSYSDDLSASKCAIEYEISPDTVNRIYWEFRTKLVGPIPVLRPSGESNLYINLKNETISISLSPLNEENHAKLSMTRTINKDKAFDYLVSYKNLRTKNILNEIDKIDGLDDFYRFCQEHIISFRGRDNNRLLWRLQELVYRYNHRHDDIYILLIKSLQPLQ